MGGGGIKTTNDWFNDRPCVVSQESPIKKKTIQKSTDHTGETSTMEACEGSASKNEGKDMH